jgi:hypothetical protein
MPTFTVRVETPEGLYCHLFPKDDMCEYFDYEDENFQFCNLFNRKRLNLDDAPTRPFKCDECLKHEYEARTISTEEVPKDRRIKLRE